MQIQALAKRPKSFFFNSLNKKAVVSLATFSLIVLIIILILTFSYFFYGVAKERSEDEIKTIELLNSMQSFRSELTNLVTRSNSNVTYVSEIDPQGIILHLDLGLTMLLAQ